MKASAARWRGAAGVDDRSMGVAKRGECDDNRRTGVWHVHPVGIASVRPRYHEAFSCQGMIMVRRLLPFCLLLALAACSAHQDAPAPVSKEELAPAPPTSATMAPAGAETDAAIQRKLADYATVKLTADLSKFD